MDKQKYEKRLTFSFYFYCGEMSSLELEVSAKHNINCIHLLSHLLCFASSTSLTDATRKCQFARRSPLERSIFGHPDHTSASQFAFRREESARIRKCFVAGMICVAEMTAVNGFVAAHSLTPCENAVRDKNQFYAETIVKCVARMQTNTSIHSSIPHNGRGKRQ